MIFLFSENYDLGESRQESEIGDQNVSNRLSSVQCSMNRKTHPLACSFKTTMESPKQNPPESNKQSLQSDAAQDTLTSWKFNLKTDEFSVRFGSNIISIAYFISGSAIFNRNQVKSKRKNQKSFTCISENSIMSQ